MARLPHTAVLDAILYLVSAAVPRPHPPRAVETLILLATIFVDQPTVATYARRPSAALNSKSISFHVNEFH